MHAEIVERARWQYGRAVHSLFGKITGMRSGAGRRVQAGIGSRAVQACYGSFTPKAVGGLLSAAAVLAITYAAAGTLVNGATSHVNARTNHATALQQAATDYRRARAGCQRLSESERGACISEAHADEDRARAMASLAPVSNLSALRSRTGAAMDAGYRDSIIVEPACNVVSRGQASVCEIQIKSGAVNASAEASAKLLLTKAQKDIVAEAGHPFVRTRAGAHAGPDRASMKVRAEREPWQRETYPINVAAAPDRSWDRFAIN